MSRKSIKSQPVKVYLTDEEWAYTGIYQKIGNLRGITDRNEKIWTMLGALMVELISSGIYEVTVFNDSRLVEEWNEDVGFISALSRGIAVRLKNEVVKKFIKFEVKKLDRFSVESAIKSLQLV